MYPYLLTWLFLMNCGTFYHCKLVLLKGFLTGHGSFFCKMWNGDDSCRNMDVIWIINMLELVTFLLLV